MCVQPNHISDGFEIEISPDRMKATLHVMAGSQVSASTIIARLREMKITRFDDGMIIESMEQRKGAELSIDVAIGIAPTGAKPERVDYRVPITDGKSGMFTRVVAGQVVAVVTAGVPGTGGSDVFGQPVEFLGPAPIQVGRNLVLQKRQIICDKPGSLHLNGNLLSVEPVLELYEDDDVARAIDFDGDAVIRGALKEGRVAKITGSLNVGGVIESVRLKTGGSVVVQGGIMGKRSGSYLIGGELRSRFISGGVVIVRQGVAVQNDITDCRLACGGRLTVQTGAIVGGGVAANSGVECFTLGNSSGVPTLVEAGAGIAAKTFLASLNQQIQANRNRIDMIREKIKPLLQLMKKLTAAQREKITEMLYDADELELSTNSLIADMELQTRILAESACAEVLVEKAVFPGVTVRFPSVKTIFNVPFKGPFALEPEINDDGIHVVLIRKTDQSRTLLPSEPVNPRPETTPPGEPLKTAA